MYNSNYYRDHMLHLNVVLPMEEVAAMGGAIRVGDQFAAQRLIERNPALAHLPLDRFGNTALHLAVRQPHPNPQIIRMVTGGNSQTYNAKFQTPYDVAGPEARALIPWAMPGGIMHSPLKPASPALRAAPQFLRRAGQPASFVSPVVGRAR